MRSAHRRRRRHKDIAGGEGVWGCFACQAGVSGSGARLGNVKGVSYVGHSSLGGRSWRMGY